MLGSDPDQKHVRMTGWLAFSTASPKVGSAQHSKMKMKHYPQLRKADTKIGNFTEGIKDSDET